MSTIMPCPKCGGSIVSFMRYFDDESPAGWKYDHERDRKASTCKCLKR